MRGSLAVAAVLASAFVLTPSAHADPAEWEVTELQPLPGDDYVQVWDINDEGVAVGRSANSPVTWDATGTPTPLATPDGCDGIATSISDTGWIAGMGFCPEEELRFASMRWDPEGEPTIDDRVIAGDTIDDNGIVAGSRVVENLLAPLGGSLEPNRVHAYAYLAGHPRIDLPEAGALESAAKDLTSWGYVVGALRDVPGLPQRDVAVGWYGDQVFPLLRTQDSSSAVAVNASGVALVTAYDDAGAHARGYLVAPGGRVVALDAAGTSDRVQDVNDTGIVVGTRDEEDGRFYVGSQSISLADIVSEADATEFGLDHPTAVNDDAWVVGQTDDGRSWLLTPPAA